MTVERVPDKKPASARPIVDLLREALADACNDKYDYIEITRKKDGVITSLVATPRGRLPLT